METVVPQIAPFLSVFVLAFLFWLGFFFLPLYMVKRAMKQVVSILLAHRSLCSAEPKSATELGLVPLPFHERVFRLRDYKPFALQALVQAGIVRVHHDGRICLLEEGWDELSPHN